MLLGDWPFPYFPRDIPPQRPDPVGYAVTTGRIAAKHIAPTLGK